MSSSDKNASIIPCIVYRFAVTLCSCHPIWAKASSSRVPDWSGHIMTYRNQFRWEVIYIYIYISPFKLGKNYHELECMK